MSTPQFIADIPSQQRFLVTCTNAGSSSGGSVEIYDYSAYATGGGIAHVVSLDVGDRPFHTAVTPDNRVAVGIDGETPGRTLLFDLMDPENYTSIEAGQNHLTFAFAPVEGGGFDIYAGRFFGPNTDGAMDIVEFVNDEWSVRSAAVPLGTTRPHTGVYAEHDQRVYFAAEGQVVGFDTTGPNKDEVTQVFPTVPGQMTPLIRATPDGRYLIGKLLHDGEPGSYFYKVDLEDQSVTTVDSISARYFAFSPDGRWIAAGDFNRDPAQTHNMVQVIDVETMTVVSEWELTGEDASNVGFHAAAFSPDSNYAYLGLGAADRVMVIDVNDLSSYTTFPTAPDPWRLRILDVELPPTSVGDWDLY